MNGGDSPHAAALSPRSFISMTLVLALLSAVSTGAWWLRGLQCEVDGLRDRREFRRGGADGAEPFAHGLIMLAIGRLSFPGDFTANGLPRVEAIRLHLDRLGVDLEPTRAQVEAAWDRVPRNARLRFTRRLSQLRQQPAAAHPHGGQSR